MSEEAAVKTNGTKTVTLNVRLKPVDHTDQPVLANYTNVGIAQSIAYVDFGFIEPVLLGAIVKRVQNGETLLKSLDGSLATRVAIPIDALVRFHQQLSHILGGNNGKSSNHP